MGNAALDPLALAAASIVALAITVALALAHRAYNKRRGWIVAALLFVVLSALGVIDLLRFSPRQTYFSTVIVGIAVPILGSLGLVRATMSVRPWVRWPLTFLVTCILVFAGFLLGAVLSRWLPF